MDCVGVEWTLNEGPDQKKAKIGVPPKWDVLRGQLSKSKDVPVDCVEPKRGRSRHVSAKEG